MFELLKEYCAVPAISGREEALRKAILKKIKPYADEIKTDALGNLLVFKKGKNRPTKKLLLDAHMDEIGFFITGITDDGFLRFAKVGGIDNKVLFGRRVVIDNIKGVIGGNAMHNLDKEQRKKVLSPDDLVIDIGADSREEAEQFVKIGDHAVFDTEFFDLGEKIAARALDDRFGCAVLTKLIQSKLPFDMWFSFSVQEEIGLRGAKCAAYSVSPDVAIVVEATTASDIADTPIDKQVCRCGSGAVLSFMDNGTVYDRTLFDFALGAAKDNNIPVQVKSAVAGGNNAGAIHVSGSGIKTIAVSLPCRYIHSAYGIAAKSDMQAVSALVEKLAKGICAGDAN